MPELRLRGNAAGVHSTSSMCDWVHESLNFRKPLLPAPQAGETRTGRTVMMKCQSVYNLLNTGPASSANVVINILLCKDFDDLAKNRETWERLWSIFYLSESSQQNCKAGTITVSMWQVLIETGVMSLVQGRHWSQHPRTGLHSFKAPGLSLPRCVLLPLIHGHFQAGGGREHSGS